MLLELEGATRKYSLHGIMPRPGHVCRGPSHCRACSMQSNSGTPRARQGSVVRRHAMATTTFGEAISLLSSSPAGHAPTRSEQEVRRKYFVQSIRTWNLLKAKTLPSSVVTHESMPSFHQEDRISSDL